MSGTDESDFWKERQDECRMSSTCLICKDAIPDSRRVAYSECEQCVHKYLAENQPEFKMRVCPRLTFFYYDQRKVTSNLAELSRDKLVSTL